jgi:two-component system phosphate regulon response regulator PhoB
MVEIAIPKALRRLYIFLTGPAYVSRLGKKQVPTATVMVREKILIVEDEIDILEVIEYNLSREGYRVLSIARSEAPDLVLLDLMLPGLDGFEVCRKLKADAVTYDIPIIMVTAKGEESDIVLGLGLGADDYVTKPFSPKELVARVKAVMRRGALKPDEGAKERTVAGSLTVDAARHEVLLDEQPVAVTPTELRLLHLLVSHPGRVFTRDQLLSRVIGEGAFVVDRNIDVHIRGIRSKLGSHRDMIETVRGVGYRFRDR